MRVDQALPGRRQECRAAEYHHSEVGVSPPLGIPELGWRGHKREILKIQKSMSGSIRLNDRK